MKGEALTRVTVQLSAGEHVVERSAHCEDSYTLEARFGLNSLSLAFAGADADAAQV